MQKDDSGCTNDPELDKGFSFLVERQRFLNNVQTRTRTSQKTFVVMRELECLLEELDLTREDLRSLTEDINRTAQDLALQPVPTKSKQEAKRPPHK